MRITLCALLCTCMLVPPAMAQDGPAIAGNLPLAVAERATPKRIISPLQWAVLTHGTTLGTSLQDPPSRQQAAPQRHWVSRHPALFGALVGFGATAVGMRVTCSPDGGGDIPCSTYMLGYGAVGAGIGAGIGFAVSALRH